ncbi:MAG: exosortase K [Gammaproteobacteria bacterium]|nr:exosortase K [Gammaproteobacteria bacterium]
MNRVNRHIAPIIKLIERKNTIFSNSYETVIISALTVLLALSVKLFYSTAGPGDLRWILYPTSALVNAFSSIDFWFDPNNGYVAIGTPVVIGAGCAGLNFFIIALCMSVFSFINRWQKSKLYVFLGLIAITYAVTLVANASRIIAGILLLEFSENLNFAVSDTLHTVQGSLFYFVFLGAYFVALQVLLTQRGDHETLY